MLLLQVVNHIYLYCYGAEGMCCSNSIHLSGIVSTTLFGLEVGSKQSQVTILRPLLQSFVKPLQSLLSLAYA